MKIHSFIFNRILILPFLLLGVNFLGFSYAHIAIQVQRSLNPWGYGGSGALDLPKMYTLYLGNLIHFDLGMLPGGTKPIVEVLGYSLVNSLGLLFIAALVSTFIGLWLGLRSVHIDPLGIRNWLNPLTTIGLATPSFFIATLLITAALYYTLFSGKDSNPPIPLSGWGWDEHLIFPLLALSVRPISQIAHSTSVLLFGELSKQYILTARSIGHTWKTIRSKHALRNILSSILTIISASYKFLFAELILVEWIFLWPGLGRLLALCLIPPSTASMGGLGEPSIYFLNPELLASLLTIYAFFLFLVDSLFQGLILWADPRLQVQENPA